MGAEVKCQTSCSSLTHSPLGAVKPYGGPLGVMIRRSVLTEVMCNTLVPFNNIAFAGKLGTG